MQKYWEVTVIWRSGFPSTVCLYMNSQHSESFKGALWNVSDSHGESLLQLKCFSRRPRYSLGMLENMECFFFPISRDMWTKTVSICSFTWREYSSSQAGTCCCEKNLKDSTWRKNAGLHLSVQQYTSLLFFNATRHACHARDASANQCFHYRRCDAQVGAGRECFQNEPRDKHQLAICPSRGFFVACRVFLMTPRWIC